MKVAIHQPNYLPWIGYFYKMFLCDTFVFHDGVPFSKRGYTKRVKVKKDRYGSDLRWLSIPIKRPHHDTFISHIDVDDSKNWLLAHKRRLFFAYGMSKYYTTVISILESVVMETDSSKLSIINQNIVKSIGNYLSLNPAFILGSSLNVTGHKSDININIINAVEAKEYISGTGANKYQTKKEYEEAGISLQIADIASFLNSPKGKSINTNEGVLEASIFDWLMRYSPNEILAIFNEAAQFSNYTK